MARAIDTDSKLSAVHPCGTKTTAVRLRSKQPALCPDCGEYPATLHDGSGWFCSACKAYVETITAIIEDNIRREQMDERPVKEARRKRWRAWYSRNKALLKEP